jgi:GntR family transcriptional regulator, arabinose operon transcriptional repressor
MAREKKYEALRAEILALIKKRGLKQDDQLPTVRELIEKFNFSYSTVHRTLIEMENEGIITKRHGKGLYVRRIPSSGATNKSVALIIPKAFSRHKMMLDILSGVRSALEKAKVSLLVSISNMSHEKERDTIAKLLANHADGLIIFLEDRYKEDYSHIAALKESNYPFVLIDRYIPELETDYVIINNIDAMARVCSYLRYNRECDEIIFVPSISSSIAASSSDEKLVGFRRSVDMLLGKKDAAVVPLDEFVRKIDILCAARKNLGVCLNHDTMIPEMNRRLKEAGKKIPGNCHIFGYNNDYEQPLYPTVEQFNDEMGRKAAEILVEKLKNPRRPVTQIRQTAKLVLPNEKGEYTIED